ncbi:MAG TPA: cyclic pyranopterin monophosphate synthase MoaC [Opitutaceae bacterium]|jgi:cyclic pyranopterin phosphate synthase|nr:cyclic pyranopterin monophosphate synthase MoaC [Opitutaceae bacterium]
MLTHLDAQNRPQMVDVGAKAATRRTARARAEITLPAALAALVVEASGERPEVPTAKGPIFQTAILAGIGGAKRTSDLIPLCHPLPLDDCKVDITVQAARPDGSRLVRIDCRVATEAKTGVEMEALTGAAVAALTVYDMGKAVSHDIVIGPVRLLEKTGGKSDFHARE